CVAHDAVAGVQTCVLPSEFTVKVVAAVPPNDTAVAPVRLVPVMTTEVPPLVDPVVGFRLVTVGTAAATKVKLSPVPVVSEVPPDVGRASCGARGACGVGAG